MDYLLDVYFFSPEDIDLNSEAFTWPTRIVPVFDENDAVSCWIHSLYSRSVLSIKTDDLQHFFKFFFVQLLEKTKLAGERHLLERKEKLMLELHKLKVRVDEFNDYGELDMMQQYVTDVRTVQKRIQVAQEEIEVIASIVPVLLTFHARIF